MKNNNVSNQSDEELFLAHRDSTKNSSREELFNCYLPLIYGVCLKYLKNNDSAEDAVVRLFNDLHGKIADYETATFRPWIYNVTKNYCLQILRREGAFIPEDDDYEPVTVYDEAFNLSLWNYIEGKCYEDEALQLEEEARYDPFLQDAMDGYDSVNDHPMYHLTKLKNQIIKRKENNSKLLKVCGIAAAILLVVALSIFFFLNNDTTPFSFSKGLASLKSRTENVDIPKYAKTNLISQSQQSQPTDDSVPVLNNSIIDDKKVEVTNKPADLPVKKSQSTVRHKKKAILEEESFETALERYTLLDNAIQSILREHGNNYNYDQKVAINTTINQAPVPIGGDRAYRAYIEKNRKLLADNDSEDQHGNVVLVFNVDGNGHPADIAVLRPLSQAADKEAVRLLQNGPRWTTSNYTARVEIPF